MQVKAFEQLDEQEKSDVLVIPFWQGKTRAEMAISSKEYEAVVLLAVQSHDFEGKLGEITIIYTTSNIHKRLLLLGLGKKEVCDKEKLRRAYSYVAKMCHQKKWKICTLFLPKINKISTLDVSIATVEGVALTNYDFLSYKHKKEKKLIEKLTIIGMGSQAKESIARTLSIIEGVNFARDLVNGNADDVTPEFMAKMGRSLAKRFSTLKVTVLGKKELEKEGCGLLLAVGRGSCQEDREPKLLVLQYFGGAKSDDTTLLVGKGVTFDTGGLNLKPTGSIETMKGDMAGAAAVLGIFQAILSLSLRANVVGVIPLTENAIDATSYKPGDVYSSFLGKTVEIGNTDAEGRLILADAIAYGQKHFKPARIIDLATLTGAIGVAIGEFRTGLFSNNKDLIEIISEAGEASGERVWPLPMDEEYAQKLKSEIADIRNCSKDRLGGAIIGAKFLEAFVKDNLPWAHLDIAYTGFTDRPKYYHTTPASGMGIRLLVEVLERLYAR